ncbi:hypothetical protein Tco_1506962 [Tanacetum coccineum]
MVHMDHDTYDRHRHATEIVEETPLHHWFKDSLEDNMEIQTQNGCIRIVGAIMHPPRSKYNAWKSAEQCMPVSMSKGHKTTYRSVLSFFAEFVKSNPVLGDASPERS